MADVATTTSPAPVHVLHINAGNMYGGVETILVTLARLRSLCPAMEPAFALCYEGRLSAELIETGSPVYVLGNARISRPWTVWRARRRLRALLEKEHFDLVICHMPWSLAIFGGTARATGAKLGFWAHAFHAGENWLERLARRNPPDVAIGNSRFTCAGLSNLFPNSRQATIYPPAALTQAPKADGWRSSARREQGAADDTVVIIQVSRIEACKGHFLHLEALARLQHLPAWVCWIVGGPQRPEEQEHLRQIRQAAEKLGIAERIRFLGQRSDIPRLLAGADIFCQPNLTPDSFGLSFIEALWAGQPVVTTDLGGAKEIVNESCGFLVPPGETAGLARSLERLIESPELRSRLGRAGAARALELCDPSTQMTILNRLSREVAGVGAAEG